MQKNSFILNLLAICKSNGIGLKFDKYELYENMHIIPNSEIEPPKRKK